MASFASVPARGPPPKPPDKGSFPLDHFRECSDAKSEYMDCLKEQQASARCTAPRLVSQRSSGHVPVLCGGRGKRRVVAGLLPPICSAGWTRASTRQALDRGVRALDLPQEGVLLR